MQSGELSRGICSCGRGSPGKNYCLFPADWAEVGLEFENDFRFGCRNVNHQYLSPSLSSSIRTIRFFQVSNDSTRVNVVTVVLMLTRLRFREKKIKWKLNSLTSFHLLNRPFNKAYGCALKRARFNDTGTGMIYAKSTCYCWFQIKLWIDLNNNSRTKSSWVVPRSEGIRGMHLQVLHNQPQVICDIFFEYKLKASFFKVNQILWLSIIIQMSCVCFLFTLIDFWR